MPFNACLFDAESWITLHSILSLCTIFLLNQKKSGDLVASEGESSKNVPGLDLNVLLFAWVPCTQPWGDWGDCLFLSAQ